MNKDRIAKNVKVLEAARDLIKSCFEDLKNVEAFRDGALTNINEREKLLETLTKIIEEAKRL